MPRITTSESNALDFCKKCFPTEAVAVKEYSSLGDAPDNRGNCFTYDDDHIDYGDESYSCDKCGKQLHSRDN